MKKVYLLFVLLVSFSFSLFASEKIEIKLQEGKEYNQKITIKSTVFSASDGQEVNTISVYSFGVKYKVLKVLDSSYEIEIKYENLSSYFEFLGEKVTFSSGGDQRDLTNILLKNLTKNSFIIVMNKQGKILETRNTQHLFSNIFENAPNLMPEDQALLKAQLEQSFGGESFAKSLETTGLFFPEKELNIDDSWEVISETTSPVALKARTIYTLKKVNENSYSLSASGKIDSINDSEPFYMGDVKIRYNIKGDASSQILIEKETGLIKAAKTLQTASGDMIINDGKITAPIRFSNEISIEQ